MNRSICRVFGSMLAFALFWYGHIVWADERMQSSVDGKSSPYQISDDGRAFCETIERDGRALAQAPVTNLIAIVRKPLQDDPPLSELQGAMGMYKDIRKYSGASWYLGSELMRHFAARDKKSDEFMRHFATRDEKSDVVTPETIRDIFLKGEAFDLLMKRDADEAWAYVRQRCSYRATLTDAVIGDRIDRNRGWYGAGDWQSVFEATNVVFRYLAIARLREWCPNDQRGHIVRSALDDPAHDVREGAIDSLQLLDSKTALDCARSYLLKWTGRSAENLSEGEKSEAERLLQRAQEYLDHKTGEEASVPRGSNLGTSATSVLPGIAVQDNR